MRGVGNAAYYIIVHEQTPLNLVCYFHTWLSKDLPFQIFAILFTSNMYI